MREGAGKSRRRHLLELLLGPLLFLTTLGLPVFDFEARAAIGTMVCMAFWWITVPVNPAVTALVPIIVNALLGILPMGDIIGCYFSEVVILLLGSELLAISWSATGFDKRISLKALCLIGPAAEQQIAAWFILPALLSTVLPNAVVCAVLTPIAYGMLAAAAADEDSPIRPLILLAIAWGAGVGGVGTPLGGAMNLIAVGYFEQVTGQEFAYWDWCLRLLPFMLLLIGVGTLYLLLIRPRGVRLEGSREHFRALYAELPPISRDEWLSIGLFAAATGLAFLRPLFEDWLPGLKPPYIFLLFGWLSFLLTRRSGEPLLVWEQAEKHIGWSLLFLIAGGLAVGNMINDSGAAAALAEALQGLALREGFGLVLLLVSFTILLAEVSSNTAAAAISLPVVLSITRYLGLNPLPYLFITAAAFNCAYILPTSIRAIPVAYGMAPAFMSKRGLGLTLLNILAISVFGWLLMILIPGFGSL